MWKILVYSAVLAVAAAADSPGQLIVNGGNAPVGEYPWQGSLQYQGSHTCGCVLISDTWVLTAAHCVDGRDVASRFQVWLGVHDRSTNQGTKYNVAQITMHPDYIASGALGYPNDMCVLRLSSPADISDPLITPVPMDSRAYDQLHDDCMMSGWGRLCGTCALPNILQHAAINTITKSACQAVWGQNTVGDYHVCVFDQENSSDKTGACSGDSGGPLQCSDTGSYQVVGLASWVASGCNTSLPAAYVRVSYFCSWIQQQTGVSCA